MYECLNLFSGPTRAWFKHAFDVPTAAQSQAWPVIHAGGNALVVAPTGSGKTLCAFLSAIDRLMTGEADRLNGSGAMTAPKARLTFPESGVGLGVSRCCTSRR